MPTARDWEADYEDRVPFVNEGVVDAAEAEERAELRQAQEDMAMLDLIAEIRREEEMIDTDDLATFLGFDDDPAHPFAPDADDWAEPSEAERDAIDDAEAEYEPSRPDPTDAVVAKAVALLRAHDIEATDEIDGDAEHAAGQVAP